MASILPQFPPFKIREDEVSAGTRWKKWFAQFENLITGMDITSMARKKALLIHYGGDEIFDLVDTFSADKKETYDALRQELDRYFTPRVNPTYEAFKLRKMKQIPQENVDQFHVRLRTQAALCSFTDIDREILAQLIEGITSSKLRKKALRERLTLDQLITEARNEELTETQARDIEKTDQACAISGKSQHKKGHEKTRGKQPTTTPKHKTTCRNCGGTFPHPSSRPCPAKGKTCLNCKKPNHFAKVCRSLKRADVKQVAEDNSDSDGVFTLQSGKKVPTTTVMINNHAIKFVVDTGASVNVITNTAYKALSPRPKLSPSSTSVYSYNTKEKLPILGCFSSRVRYKERTIEAQFYVVEGLDNSSSNLLSAVTSEALEIISFARQVNVPEELYEGFGKIKGLNIKLHIDEQVHPKKQTHRRIPYHVRKSVEKEIQRLEEQDIIEQVEGPTPWVSPIVVVPKKSGGVRLCVDMREANKAIKRERHPLPTIEDMINDLNGSTLFSRIDLQQAFHQLELDKESRFITTFSTHVGLRRFKRLMFGVNAAPEIFQHAMSDILHDIPGVTHFIDDIIVHGKDRAAHDASLTETLKRLTQRGVKLNKEKCLFGVNKLSFLGHTFGDRGISPEAQKIKAITSAKAPTSISELRSFLGMTQFVSRYIESYASITEPLRKLTRKTQPWKWGREQDEAFKKLKKLLTEVGVMAYFDPKKETNVVVDASPCGLGAMIMQQGRVICYSSRALTDVESRYSQTEREMLAVVYGVEKFHIYLYGSTFSVITDHKPLLGIIGSSKPASARIDRWRLRLMPYQYTLTYRPGKDEANPADYLSRHPFITPQRDNDGENYIRYIAKTSIPNALTLEEVKQATASDKTLQNVMTAITTGNWDSRSVSPFKSIKDELTIHDGIVLRQSRILIPDSLQLRVVKLAHSAHQGIVKTKQLLREKVWFSGIDKLVETHLKGCIPCQSATVGSKQRDPIKTTPLPKHPWDELSADFAGPFPSGELLLIVIDDYSRFPEVQIVNSTSARTTIPKLMEMFSRFGTPSVLKTDNGAPFNSGEFAAFAKKLGFKHRKITPLWPEANGEAERFVRTLNKFVHTCQAEHSDWRVELQDLLCQYRATPHTSTKISPHEALTGRQMRTALPELKATP